MENKDDEQKIEESGWRMGWKNPKFRIVDNAIESY